MTTAGSSPEPGEGEAGSVWEGYTLLSYLKRLRPGAIVALEVRYVARAPQGRPRRRRYRQPEQLEHRPGEAGQWVEWLPVFEHGYQIDPSHGPQSRGGPGLIRQLERYRDPETLARGVGPYFDNWAREWGRDDLEAAHRFKVYVIGFEGEPGVWPAT